MNTPWRILLVEDNAGDAEDIKRRIGGWKFNSEPCEVESCPDFGTAKDWLATRRYDLAVLDLIDDKADGWAIGKAPKPEGEEPELAGHRILGLIRSTRALPVIFHTAHPERLEINSTLITKVVTKGEWALLQQSIGEIINTRIPELLRRIEDVQRDYLWTFVEKHFTQIGTNPMEAAILLARRLAFLLRKETLDQNGFKDQEKVQPVEFYIYPRDEGDPQGGDIYLQKTEKETKYFLLLTPSCDMVAGRIKSSKALLIPCTPLVERSAYKDWKAKPDQPIGKEPRPTTTDILAGWLTGRQPQEDRTFFLPPAFDIPALVGDFQNSLTVDFGKLGKEYKRLATLDSPFSEAAAARFARYFGRLGTPDLDVQSTLERIKNS